MRSQILLLSCFAVGSHGALAVDYETKPVGEQYSRLSPIKAPEYASLYLKSGDRIAIIGDSITEQRQYSRIIETYLTVALPELKITARQFGWSAETAEGFKKRMHQDCLRFKPTIATLCYGMNDHRYRPYEEKNAAWYRDNYGTVAKTLKNSGARVVIGSPGPIGRMPPYAKKDAGTVEDFNHNLCAFRNIGIGLAKENDLRFADVFWPMILGYHAAKERYGANYELLSQDGVHPDWAGHVVMAYAFLTALGCDGNIGQITVDLAKRKATASPGHTIDRVKADEIAVTSTRYPFCATGAIDKQSSIRSGMTLVPFMQKLNRFILVAKGGSSEKYTVTWGSESRSYSAVQLAAGVNLADDFQVNPFSSAFKLVDEAVKKKQEYETEQIKKHFHGTDGKADIEKTVLETEAIREPLAKAITSSFVPVAHAIFIKPTP